jgi:toxin-antitoxin system PIN domain toxin
LSPDVLIDLPDVNVLVALHVPDHEHRVIAERWFDGAEAFATTPITELGLMRVLLAPLPTNRSMPGQVLAALDALTSDKRARFLPDDEPTRSQSRFAYAVTGHRQVTDIHLLSLATAHGGRLVTLNRKIAAALRPADRPAVHVLR